jgi:hypothetical protein
LHGLLQFGIDRKEIASENQDVCHIIRITHSILEETNAISYCKKKLGNHMPVN